MRQARLTLLLLVTLILTGCWSRRELTDVSFAGLIGIDRVEDQYLVTVDIMQAGKPGGGKGEAGGGERSAWTVSERGKAIDEALARIDEILPRSLTLAHVRAIVYGEEAARHGIGQSLDYLLRSVEVRPTAWIAVTNGMARDLLLARPREEILPSNTPLGYEDAALKRTSVLPARRLTEVANNLHEEGGDLSLALYRRGNQEAPAQDGALSPRQEYAKEMIYGGMGVFVNDKLVAFAGPHVARGALWTVGRVVHGAVASTCPDESQGMVVFRLRKSAGRLKVFLEGGRLRAQFNVYVVADVNEQGCSRRMIKFGNEAELGDLLGKSVREEILKAVDLSRSTGSDFLGIGRALYRSNPAEYKRRAENWSTELKSMPIDIRVRTKVTRLGQLNRRYQWKSGRHG